MNDNMIHTRTGSKPKLLLIGVEGLDHWQDKPGYEVIGLVDLYAEWPSGCPFELHEQLRGCPVFAGLEEALEQTEPDVACISVPGGGKTRIDAEALLLRRGIDVLAKKVRLNSMADVDRLKEACAAGSGTLYVGEHYKHLPQALELKRLASEGALGDIVHVTWRCLLPYEVYDWMKGYRHLSLEDLAYHHFGVLHAAFGFDPAKLYAHSYEPDFSRTESRTIASVLATVGSYHLNYELVWCSRRKPFSYFGEVTVEGSKATAVATDDLVRLYASDGSEQTIECPATPYEGMWSLLDHWRDTAGEGSGESAKASAEPPFTFEQFEPVLRAIYRAVQSAESCTVQ